MNFRPTSRLTTILLTGLLLAITLIAILQIQRMLFSNLKQCDLAVTLPTIKESGPGFVILAADNGVRLTPNQGYKLEAFSLGVKLFQIDSQGATIIYHENRSTAGELGIPPTTLDYWCKQYVRFEDNRYRARTQALWPQPSEFAIGWKVLHYAELANVYPPYPASIPTDDSYLAFLDVGHQTSDIAQGIPYEIRISVSTYDTEEVAQKAFESNARSMDALYGTPHQVSLDSQIAQYVAYCYLAIDHICEYIGQYGNRILGFGMSIPHKRLQRISVPLQDLQYLVTLIEAKATNINQ